MPQHENLHEVAASLSKADRQPLWRICCCDLQEEDLITNRDIYDNAGRLVHLGLVMCVTRRDKGFKYVIRPRGREVQLLIKQVEDIQNELARACGLAD